VLIFAALIVLFRHLLVVLVFFVAFERPLEWACNFLAARTGVRRTRVLVAVLFLGVGLLTLAVWAGYDWSVSAFQSARESLPARIAALKQTPLFALVQERVDADMLLEAAKHQTERALSYLGAFGHLVIHALIGFVLAIVFIVDEPELRGFEASLQPRSLGGTLLRWLGHAADAVSVTLQFQLVVAAVNAVLTWPVLFFVGLGHSGALVFMIFVSGIIPVVGNFLSGAVLTLLAYQVRGVPGAVLFVVLTAVLHKLESYYLNPRLAARHVRLPGFVLIVSLLLWEQVLGFVGLFVSFPFLFLAMRIWSEFAEEDRATSAVAAA
jgi:predicted PurR-regulated permease PerM